MGKISRVSHGRIVRLHNEGFSVIELSMMYRATTGSIERILESQHQEFEDFIAAVANDRTRAAK